jgi:hypothetical protein
MRKRKKNFPSRFDRFRSVNGGTACTRLRQKPKVDVVPRGSYEARNRINGVLRRQRHRARPAFRRGTRARPPLRAGRCGRHGRALRIVRRKTAKPAAPFPARRLANHRIAMAESLLSDVVSKIEPTAVDRGRNQRRSRAKQQLPHGALERTSTERIPQEAQLAAPRQSHRRVDCGRNENYGAATPASCPIASVPEEAGSEALLTARERRRPRRL